MGQASWPKSSRKGIGVYTPTMSNTDFDTENIIAVTLANLKDEQKQAMEKAMEEYKQLCWKSFSVNRSSEVI